MDPGKTPKHGISHIRNLELGKIPSYLLRKTRGLEAPMIQPKKSKSASDLGSYKSKRPVPSGGPSKPEGKSLAPKAQTKENAEDEKLKITVNKVSDFDYKTRFFELQRKYTLMVKEMQATESNCATQVEEIVKLKRQNERLLEENTKFKSLLAKKCENGATSGDCVLANTESKKMREQIEAILNEFTSKMGEIFEFYKKE